ncbi:MAG TPA: aminodeoxychorismate synthase component I, partial [Candidatus Hydrogenedentes bacterium]|nr:aminodeoxychorismate synthase component I [Candidatus Hydrogenedentota bacterium]
GAQLFHNPETLIVCRHDAEIPDAMRRLDAFIAQGCYVAGFLAYEAGWAFLDRPIPKQTPEFPLVWFGVYKTCMTAPPFQVEPQRTADQVQWQPAQAHEEYGRSLDAIRAYIAAGDAYQVNFTFPLEARFSDDPLQWFRTLYAAQPTNHAAYLDTGRHKILSLSPELFFQLSGQELTTRPMKGTLPRGLYPEQDEHNRRQLLDSEKDRAENVMIVDLLRNDMGKISRTNSVDVVSLFDVEKYATVWQMTSAIKSQTNASFSEIMAALFPSGSVTGAPKIRAMEIIDELEPLPRGAYCGAIGWWGPNRTASFNVAIRTITLDTRTEKALYPVGGGITWYSSTEGEYAECLAKARTVMEPSPTFSLVETMLYNGTIFLLEEHLDRLCASANFFNIPVNRAQLRETTRLYAASLTTGHWKLRLLLHCVGTHHLEAAPINAANLSDPTNTPKTLKVTLANTPINRNNVFLYHKTTHRSVYEEARQAHPEVDDVLLWNEAGELTESAIANIVAEVDGKLITPPTSCGLLAGVMRGHLLHTGKIQEGVIHKEDLERSGKLFLINSVRGWMQAEMQQNT